MTEPVLPHLKPLQIKGRIPVVYMERDVRLACCDAVRQIKLLQRIIPTIEQVLSAGELVFEKLEEVSSPQGFCRKAKYDTCIKRIYFI